MAAQLLDFLRRRRKKLGISIPLLSVRSGVSERTLKRMFGRHCNDASLENTIAVASAMGVEIRGEMKTNANSFREKVAREKAKKVVRMVQGTSLLEAQGVGPSQVAEMIKKTTHELVAGSNRRLWSQ